MALVIPKRCFEPITSVSVYYMFKDFFLVACLYLLSEWTWRVLPSSAQLAVTPVYWLVQGTLFTGIFVVGHDAGHGSFSNSELVNSICGNICHTFLLCPYYMWKLSHKHHHKNTGNIDKDEVFYPVRKSQDPKVRLLIPGFGLGIGWFMYLVHGYRPRGVAHFNLWFPLFKKHMFQCSVSLACLIGWCLALNWCRLTFGLGAVLYHHTVPTCIFATYIVIITFLHHSEEGVPWYGDDIWTNVRGQLSSVDRVYGWCHSLIHNIGTHQIHHLFPKVPHYRLEEATAHFRKAFPSLVNISDDRILPAFCRMFAKYAHQNVVDDKASIHFYKKQEMGEGVGKAGYGEMEMHRELYRAVCMPSQLEELPLLFALKDVPLFNSRLNT
ncbi:hypothetical protein RRG08_013338 [Elysia crispata]|uniref:Fatty acid desaturase domain-containing protein n=1 Tax=Elysia crispata TaxID=231223 RepID=A0AAE1E7R7_9GAST|nr:hypothetical protein RRG08_013338 [Elysia crispata]